MHLPKSKAGFATVLLTVIVALGIAACGSSSKTTSTSSGSSNSGSSSSSTGSTGGSSASASISAESFTNDFSAMAALKSVAAAGKGKIAAILPDTTSSTRYVEFDQPDLKAAALAAGVPSSDIIIQNGQDSDTTFLSDAQADITNGATVLLIDPEDPATGLQVENYAAAHGAKVINYDRLVTGGPANPYISFDNVHVGELMGQGFEACATAWHVAKPNVIVMRGDPTDNNASLFYQGYFTNVLSKDFSSGKYTLAANTAGTWTPQTAQTEFEQALTAHPNANSALIPNDENGAPIITYLRSHGIKPETFPTTGQDATLTGLQNIISGYQCGTVYKAVYKEASAAMALAIYLRAGQAAPSSLLNGSVTDPKNGDKVPSVLLTPVWVTPKNMAATVLADKFVPAAQLCAGSYAADCKKYGITS